MSQVHSFSRALQKIFRDWGALSTMLRGDLLATMEFYRTSGQSQFAQRMYIRAGWSLIEGMLYGLKQFLLNAAVLGDKVLTGDERKLLDEETFIVASDGRTRLKERYPDTLQNIKEGLKLCARLLEVEATLKFDDVRWTQVGCSLEVRHRITHPKLPSEFSVSDDEFNSSNEAVLWFLDSLREIQTQLLEKYGSKYAGGVTNGASGGKAANEN